MARPLNHAQRHHSRLSPSGAHQWMACPGSPELIEELGPVEEQRSDPAEEGTAAHELLEQCLVSGKPPVKFLGKTFNEFKVTEEMADAVEVCWSYVRDLMKRDKKAVMTSEEEVELPEIDGQGHTDVSVWLPTLGELYVIDYKHGAGLAVEAKGNAQLRLYTIGKLNGALGKETRRIKKFYNVIVQPRCPHPDGPVRVDSFALPSLMKFKAEVVEVVKQIKSGSAPLVPGEDQCRWCKAKASCPAVAEFVAKQTRLDFAEFICSDAVDEDKAAKSLKGTRRLSLDQVASIYRHAGLIRDYLKAIEGRMWDAMSAGEKVDGFKLVAGRSNRQWKDEDLVTVYLSKLGLEEDDYMPRSLLGIGAVEKLIPKDRREAAMKKLTIKPPGSPVIAVESDPRPSLPPRSAAEEFKNHIAKREEEP